MTSPCLEHLFRSTRPTVAGTRGIVDLKKNDGERGPQPREPSSQTVVTIEKSTETQERQRHRQKKGLETKTWSTCSVIVCTMTVSSPLFLWCPPISLRRNRSLENDGNQSALSVDITPMAGQFVLGAYGSCRGPSFPLSDGGLVISWAVCDGWAN